MLPRLPRELALLLFIFKLNIIFPNFSLIALVQKKKEDPLQGGKELNYNTDGTCQYWPGGSFVSYFHQQGPGKVPLMYTIQQAFLLLPQLPVFI